MLWLNTIDINPIPWNYLPLKGLWNFHVYFTEDNCFQFEMEMGGGGANK